MEHPSLTPVIALAFLALHADALAQNVVAVDRFGRTYTADQIEADNSPAMMSMGGGGCPSPCAAGIFLLDFAAGSGFDDPIDGPARQEVARQVFEDYSQLIVPADDPCNGPNLAPFVRVWFPAPSGIVPPGAAGVGSSFYNYVTINNSAIPYDDFTPASLQEGVLDGEVWRTINGGMDSWRSINYAIRRGAAGLPQFLNHGLVSIDFNAAPFYTGTSLPVPAGMADLYSVIAHEATHMLGFHTFTTQAGLGFLNSRYYSRYDLLLGQGGTAWIVDPLLCSDWDTNTDPAFDLGPGGCGTTVSGNYTTVPQPVHAPTPWNGSSLSHLDGDCGSLPYLMHHNNLNPFGMSRVPLQEEVNVLCDIDYHTTTQHGTSGSGWDDTYHVRTSCGKRLAGVDDLISDCTTRPFYTYKQGQALPITIDNFLENDEDEANTTLGIIGTPQSYACMEVILGGDNGIPPPASGSTSFQYRPDPGYVGWAIIRYRPVSVDGRLGNITYIFVEVWPPDVCGVEPCNILNGGTFEGLPLQSRTGAPYDSYQRTGASSNSPDLFALDPSLPPPNWLEMNSYTTMVGMCGPPMLIVPGAGLPPNERYLTMIASVPANANNEGLLFELCRPLLDGVTYSVEYKARTGGCARDLRFYAFHDRPCNPLQGLTNFAVADPCNGGVVPIECVPLQTVSSSPWQLHSIAFTFTGSPRNWLVVLSSGPTFGSLSVDDLAIRPIITATPTITPSCNGQNNGSIALDVHYYPGSYSILWNTSATTATLADLAPGTYTVTITDTELGCATFTESYVVGNADCAGPFTLTKWVTPNNPANTYAGAPVMFTIQACNNDASDQVVDITDEMPAGFVPAFNSPNDPYWPTATVTIPAGQCITTEITGYFTQIGPHTNTATLEQAPGVSLSADATVNLLQGCPMLVSGNGGCQPGDPVNLCLGMHTQLTDVESIDYYIIYPDFLEPPAPGSILGNITGPFPIASATMGTPTGLSWPPGYSAVPVHVAFSTPVSPSPPYTFFCIGFTVGTGGVPPGVNAEWTWASTTPSEAGWNRVTVNMAGGSADLWTQAYHILFTGCEGINAPNANFTVEVPNCGGEVSVAAALGDPDAIHIWTWGDERTTPTNGAPNWTYDYFGPITDNQGWPVNIPPAAPGTYTITHTVIVDGVVGTSTQQVTITECCPAVTVIQDGKYSSTFGSTISGTVDIQGQFIIDQDFTFSNAQVTTEPGAEIIVQPGRNFNVFNSTIESCQGVMWRVITAQVGTIVQVDNSYLADAESGWTGMNNSILLVSASEFANNRVAISVPAIPGVDFNSVSIHADNSEFHAEGPLAQPYPGQTSVLGQQGFAALEVYNMTLDFTGQANVLHHLSNGIVARRCNVRVANCAMHDIQPDAAYAYTGNGAGIYARGDHGSFSLKQSGYGIGNLAAASFTKCRWGIYTEYMNVYSTANRMVDMGTAYRVDRSGGRKVHITGNKLDTRYNSIDLRFNDGAVQLLVADNDITFGSLHHENTKGYTAINVQEGNAANPASVIQGNTIHYRHGSLYAANGIALLSASDYQVLGNTLLMDNNAVNRMGIIAAGCRRPLISCNDVHGSATNYGVLQGQSAIRSNMGDHATLYCNTVDGTTNGIYFSGPCYGTDLSGNNIKRHQWGLHLDNNAIIEEQDFKGNLWYNAPVNGGLGAWYENTTNAGAYPFLYEQEYITGGNTEPPSWVPLGWFIPHPGTNYQCGDEQSGYCGHVVREACVGCITGLDGKIAADSLANDPYTEETKWVMEGDLYGKLDNDASLMATDQELADFYATMQGTTTAQFKLINDDYLALFHLDSTVLDYLAQNKAQLEDLMDQLKLAMDSLRDPGLTSAEHMALQATIGGLQQNISSLTALNNQALALADTSRALTAEGVKATNASIATSELIEANEKQVNGIYLSTVAKGIDGFTPEQSTTLFAIANQCPLTGGNAVYRARALYALIDDEQDYDDPVLCLQHGLIYRSMQQVGDHAITVVPNPATDHASLVLDEAWDAPGVFVVYDAMGAEVMRAEVPAYTSHWEFSTAALAPAMYHYRVRGPSGKVSDGKLSIIR